MTTAGWLIFATFADPTIGAAVAAVLIGRITILARTRAQRVEHVPADGADLYCNGVPLTEAQFRGAAG